jgi:hypothetical protein
MDRWKGVVFLELILFLGRKTSRASELWHAQQMLGI